MNDTEKAEMREYVTGEISSWISNDESLYNRVLRLVRYHAKWESTRHHLRAGLRRHMLDEYVIEDVAREAGVGVSRLPRLVDWEQLLDDVLDLARDEGIVIPVCFLRKPEEVSI